MRIRFFEIAQIELDDAIEYYNYEIPGLGDAFLTEVLNTLDRIGKYPEYIQELEKGSNEPFSPGILREDVFLCFDPIGHKKYCNGFHDMALNTSSSLTMSAFLAFVPTRFCNLRNRASQR